MIVKKFPTNGRNNDRWKFVARESFSECKELPFLG